MGWFLSAVLITWTMGVFTALGFNSLKLRNFSYRPQYIHDHRNKELYAYRPDRATSVISCGASCVKSLDNCHGVNFHGGQCHLLVDLSNGGPDAKEIDAVPGGSHMTGDLPTLFLLENTTYDYHTRPAELVSKFSDDTPDDCTNACNRIAECHAVDITTEANGTVTCALFKNSSLHWVGAKDNTKVYLKDTHPLVDPNDPSSPPKTLPAPLFFAGFEESDSDVGINYPSGYHHKPGLVGRAAMMSGDPLGDNPGRYFSIDTPVMDKCPFYPGDPDCQNISFAFWMREDRVSFHTQRELDSAYFTMKDRGGANTQDLLEISVCVNNGTHLVEHKRWGPDRVNIADNQVENLTSANTIFGPWWFHYVVTVSNGFGIKLYMNGLERPYRTYPDVQGPCTDVGPDELWVSKSKEDEGMFNPVTDALTDWDEMMFWDVELTAEQVWEIFYSYNSTGFTEFPPW